MLTVREGSSSTDKEWDLYLQHSPYGHYEQCSGWAAAKATEGWRCSRTEIVENNRIIGGFQILFRRKGFFRIGYISKGPAIDIDNSDLTALTIKQIKSQAARNKLSALLVQPPELCNAIPPILAQNGFLPNRIQKLVKANLYVDTACGKEAIWKKMNRILRQEIRKSMKRGAVIREGDESDFQKFFNLMLKSCERQGKVKPVPDNVIFFQKLGKQVAFRLTFVEIAGEAIAGLISIPFGERVTFYKKGWNGEHRDCYPNSLLFHEALEWAWEKGYKFCDFLALDHDLAKTRLSGHELTSRHVKSRHYFNLGFGGAPIIFPDSFIWLSNRLIRRMYQLLFYRK